MNNIPVATTTNTIEELQKRCQQLEQQVDELTAKLKWFDEQYRLSCKRRFGSSSERIAPGQLQLQFFNEAESEATPDLAEPTVETILTAVARKRPPGKPAERPAGFESFDLSHLSF